MSEREKRNEVDVEGMIDGAEILARASFRKDEDDEGFTTTRWLSLSALDTVDKEALGEELELLEERIRYLKQRCSRRLSRRSLVCCLMHAWVWGVARDSTAARWGHAGRVSDSIR